MSGTSKTGLRKPLTVLLDADLEARLHAERARIEAETGLQVSMTQVAARAMRAGFGINEPHK